MIDTQEQCSYSQCISNERGTNQMLFDLSQYLSFNAFAFLWIVSMLAAVAFFGRNDNKRK